VLAFQQGDYNDLFGLRRLEAGSRAGVGHYLSVFRNFELKRKRE
jgi:hypothetical protein